MSLRLRAGAARELGALLESGTAAGLDEAQLLRRFAQGDQTAFRALLERHGPRVLGVCRRELRDTHAADDAFQATFLVLARRAGSIGRPERLGGWLSGVARRVARKARGRATTRARHERGAARDECDTAAARDPDLFETVALLGEELDRLPDEYRKPIELCYLEGRTTDETARLLGWPRGTVGTRVARGRERLRQRLEQRGVSWAVLPLCGTAKLPASLLARTIRLLDPAETASLCPIISTLAEGTLRSMLMKKMTSIAVATTLCVGVAGIAGHQALAARGAAAAPGGAPIGALRPRVADDQSAIQGTWVVTKVELDEDGPPAEMKDTLMGMAWTFKGDQFESSVPLRPGKIRFELDPKKDPKTLTLHAQDSRPMVALYKFDGEELWVALGRSESDPPRGFTLGDGDKSPVILLGMLPEAKAPKRTAEQEKAARKAVDRAREGARRAMSMNNLKQLALAMHNWADVTGKGFPPAAICDNNGRPLLSWRVAVLPYIEQEALYKQFRLDEPWDSEHNKALIAKMPKLYAPVTAGDKAPEPGTTYYQVFVGGGALFDTAKPRPLTEIRDGTSNTFLIAEAHDPVVWTKPDDMEFDPNGGPPALGGTLFEDGFHAALADGSVKFFRDTVNQQTLRAMITATGGEAINGQ